MTTGVTTAKGTALLRATPVGPATVKPKETSSSPTPSRKRRGEVHTASAYSAQK